MTPESLLREGLSGWGLAADAAPRLLEFSDRLLEKNRVMNLTAITDPVDVVTLHLLDCAALLRMEDFRGKRVVDVGTGAGFSGDAARLLEPDFDLTLLDSLGQARGVFAGGLQRDGAAARDVRPCAGGGVRRAGA